MAAPAMTERSIAVKAPVLKLSCTAPLKGGATELDGTEAAETETDDDAAAGVVMVVPKLGVGAVTTGVLDTETDDVKLTVERETEEEDWEIVEVKLAVASPTVKVGVEAKTSVTLPISVACTVYPGPAGMTGKTTSILFRLGSTLFKIANVLWNTVLTRKTEKVAGSPCSFVQLTVALLLLLTLGDILICRAEAKGAASVSSAKLNNMVISLILREE